MRLLTDEDFNRRILRGLQRRRPNLDIITVQDAGLRGRSDAEVLQWAADETRIVVTHDVSTLSDAAYERVRASLPMPGVFEVNRDLPIGEAIDGLILLVECSHEGEWENRICFLPFR